jgi:hypothetical protein
MRGLVWRQLLGNSGAKDDTSRHAPVARREQSIVCRHT